MTSWEQGLPTLAGCSQGTHPCAGGWWMRVGWGETRALSSHSDLTCCGWEQRDAIRREPAYSAVSTHPEGTRTPTPSSPGRRLHPSHAHCPPPPAVSVTPELHPASCPQTRLPTLLPDLVPQNY